MKSKKAEEYLFENGLGYPYTGYVTEPVAERAAELAEQEAEERMRAKAISAFCENECGGTCRRCEKTDECETLGKFIQKLNGE